MTLHILNRQNTLLNKFIAQMYESAGHGPLTSTPRSRLIMSW